MSERERALHKIKQVKKRIIEPKKECKLHDYSNSHTPSHTISCFLSQTRKYKPRETNIPIQELRAEVTTDGSHDLASDVLRDACIASLLLALLVAAPAAVARHYLVVAQVTFVGGESKTHM